MVPPVKLYDAGRPNADVIRILVPLVVEDDDLARGLEILEEALVDADASG